MGESPAYPSVTPYLLYEDVGGMLAWLAEAFGFRERVRYEDAGAVTHAEMETPEGGVIMLGYPGGDYLNPIRSGHHSVYTHVYVEDVDSHCERARKAGATIERDLADQPYGDRNYNCWDAEGQRWTFAQHVRDVDPEEWGATSS